MSGVVGSQDFWIVGSRVYFQVDPGTGVFGEAFDFGTVQSARPTMTPTVRQFKDAYGGRVQVVAQDIEAQDEQWSLTLNNLSTRVQRFLYMSDAEEAAGQSAASFVETQTVKQGGLVKVAKDTLPVFALSSIGIYAATGNILSHTITDMTSSTKTIKLLAGDGDVTAEYPTGAVIIVRTDGLATIGNAGTYAVASSAFTTITSVVVNETIGSDEISITGKTIVGDVGNSPATIYDGPDQTTPDWTVHSLDQGLLQIASGGSIADGSVIIAASTAALTGDRKLRPHSATSPIEGRMVIIMSRANHAEQTVRWFRASLVPNGEPNFSVTEPSTIQFLATVIGDVSDSVTPASELIHIKGAIPALSTAGALDEV